MNALKQLKQLVATYSTLRLGKAVDLLKHILATYSNLRIGVAVVALAFPLILWFGPQLLGIKLELQPSMSAYYHTPMRNAFVGILFIVGSFLYAYRGYTLWEDKLLNVAGILAIGIAVFPTGINCSPDDLACLERAKLIFTSPKLHGFCAVGFFICISLVTLSFRPTLDLVQNQTTKKALTYTYIALAALMIVLPLIAAYLSYYSPENGRHVIFWVEFAAVYVFATYWMVKSFEVKETALEMMLAISEASTDVKALSKEVQVKRAERARHASQGKAIQLQR